MIFLIVGQSFLFMPILTDRVGGSSLLVGRDVWYQLISENKTALPDLVKNF